MARLADSHIRLLKFGAEDDSTHQLLSGWWQSIPASELYAIFGSVLPFSSDKLKQFMEKENVYGFLILNREIPIGHLFLGLEHKVFPTNPPNLLQLETPEENLKRGHIFFVFIRPDNRGKGIGTQAMKKLAEIALEEFQLTTLSVNCFEFNSKALNFYHKTLGFPFKHTDAPMEYQGEEMEFLGTILRPNTFFVRQWMVVNLPFTFKH